jgi:hypothetical protein
MDADKFRPVPRSLAADAGRSRVRRPRNLARPALDAGPQQQVRELLYDLHEKAGRPALESLANRIAADDRLDGSPKKDLIRRIISEGGPAVLEDVLAVAQTLARACGQDEHSVAAQVIQLMRSPRQPPVPTPLLSPRSAYLAQIRQIAPPTLISRETELQQLAGFCLDEQVGTYTWWQAPPWAGKSALLSTFVLNPPEMVRSRVQVAAFFITARFAAQDTRQAFTAVIGEQLAALTGQRVPAVIDESLREAWLLDLIAQAAEGCQRRGTRLVLLVDGLDEDRGVTTGPYARSIAALLPGAPPAGMRVIVAGRPNPPVPDDVPDWHPLRDPDIIRPLPSSPHARDLQRLGQTELKRLLTGSPIEQDLLGLLTAARGGLSSDDLHELTGAGLTEIEEVLHTVAGRTFIRRSTQLASAGGLVVYLLGHEELDDAARRYLGKVRLTGYRSRLHEWADRYRHPGRDGSPWPHGSPEYLLFGYSRMLSTDGDISRPVDLVTDPDRHERMLESTGGDAAALAEIVTCQDLVLAGPGPDLEAMLRLCLRRNDLADRNDHIPANLPVLLITLGQRARAEALASSITDPCVRALALAEVARAIAGMGDFDHARRLADQAETIARSVTEPEAQAHALTTVATANVAAGRLARAAALASSIDDPPERAYALAKVTRMITGRDDREQAKRFVDHVETEARSNTNLFEQIQMLAEAATAMAHTGDLDHARRLADQAETIARSITSSGLQEAALGTAAQALVTAGEFDRAGIVASLIDEPVHQGRLLAEVAEAIAHTGDVVRARHFADRAETVARLITSPYHQADTLVAVAGAITATGDLDHALRLADEAETVARLSTDGDYRTSALAATANAIAIAGDFLQAGVLARSIADPNRQARALAEAAKVISGTEAFVQAGHLADQSETIARSITDPSLQAQALTEAAWAFATAGEPDRAGAIARSITEPISQVQALTAVAKVVAGTGDVDRARHLADQAETAARLITDSHHQAQTLVAVVEAIAATGDLDQARHLADQAEIVAHSITAPDRQARALADVVSGIATVDPDRAEAIARSITEPDRQAQALADVVSRLATVDPDRAVKVTRSITEPDELARALADLASGIAAVDPDRAVTIALSITVPYRRAQALTAVTKRISATGDLGRAEAIARSITEPDQQAQALTAVAKTVATTGDLTRAGRLLASALAVASWKVSLLMLGEHWPQVVHRHIGALSGTNVREAAIPARLRGLAGHGQSVSAHEIPHL